jgi:hypothetical protein
MMHGVLATSNSLNDQPGQVCHMSARVAPAAGGPRFAAHNGRHLVCLIARCGSVVLNVAPMPIPTSPMSIQLIASGCLNRHHGPSSNRTEDTQVPCTYVGTEKRDAEAIRDYSQIIAGKDSPSDGRPDHQLPCGSDGRGRWGYLRPSTESGYRLCFSSLRVSLSPWVLFHWLALAVPNSAVMPLSKHSLRPTASSARALRPLPRMIRAVSHGCKDGCRTQNRVRENPYSS